MTIDEQIKNTIEQTQRTNLLIRYFAAVDDKCLDLKIVEATFTSDAKIIRPDNTAIVGQEHILDGHLKSFARFKGTHHGGGNERDIKFWTVKGLTTNH
jgi:hypothetical protein